MSTPSKRAQANEQVWNENHAKIEEALRTARIWYKKTDWLTVTQLSKITGLKRETIYHHLRGVKGRKGFLQEKRVVKEGKRYCMLPYLQFTQAIEKVLEVLYALAIENYYRNPGKFEFNEATFFIDNLLVIVPVKVADGIQYNVGAYPLNELIKGPEALFKFVLKCL